MEKVIRDRPLKRVYLLLLHQRVQTTKMSWILAMEIVTRDRPLKEYMATWKSISSYCTLIVRMTCWLMAGQFVLFLVRVMMVMLNETIKGAMWFANWSQSILFFVPTIRLWIGVQNMRTLESRRHLNQQNEIILSFRLSL